MWAAASFHKKLPYREACIGLGLERRRRRKKKWRIRQLCARNSLVTFNPWQTQVTDSHIEMKNKTGRHVRLYDAFVLPQICDEAWNPAGYLWAWLLSPLFLSSSPSLIPSFCYSSAVKWTSLPLWGRVARLPVVVRLCMNQSGDRAAGRMADATARKLFNQAALPSRGQGETLHRWMKKNDRQPHGHSHTHTHTYCMLAHMCIDLF